MSTRSSAPKVLNEVADTTTDSLGKALMPPGWVSPAFLEHPPEETTSRLAPVALCPLMDQALKGTFPLESR